MATLTPPDPVTAKRYLPWVVMPSAAATITMKLGTKQLLATLGYRRVLTINTAMVGVGQARLERVTTRPLRRGCPAPCVPAARGP